MINYRFSKISKTKIIVSLASFLVIFLVLLYMGAMWKNTIYLTNENIRLSDLLWKESLTKSKPYSVPNGTAKPTNKEEDQLDKNKDDYSGSFHIELIDGKLWFSYPDQYNGSVLLLEEQNKRITEFLVTPDIKYLLYLVEDKGGDAQLYRYIFATGAHNLVTNDIVTSFYLSPNGKYIAYNKDIKVAPYSCCGGSQTKDTRPWGFIMQTAGGSEIKVKNPYTSEEIIVAGIAINKNLDVALENGQYFQYFPNIFWDGFTKEGNFVVFAAGILDVQSGLFAIDNEGNPIKYLEEEDVVKMSPQLMRGEPENVSASYNYSKLYGFPIYPDSVFKSAEKYGPCLWEKTTIHDICSSILYQWEAPAKYEDVYSWYMGKSLPNGWNCGGGALGLTTCSNGDMSFTVGIYEREGARTEVNLEIPY